MGFFNFDKPGPGVNPNAPKKKGIFLYFELLFRKIGAFIKANLLYFFASLPMIVLCFFAGMFFINWFSNLFKITDPILKTQASTLLAFLLFVFIGSSPASAAFAHFFRSIMRDEHTTVLSDFFSNFKKNIGQGLLVGIINPVIIFASAFCTGFYGMQYLMTGQLMWFAFMLIIGLFTLIFTMTGFYIYQLMITFENSILELYKNAFILALIKAPQNLAIMLIIAVIAYLVCFVLTPVALLVLTGLLGIAMARFAIELYTARVIEKNILKK